MLARSKQIKEEKAEAIRASLASSSDGTYALRKKRGKDDIPEVIRIPTDIRKDARYEGQTAFMFKYVPLKCVDETTEVGEDTIREYIYCAIIEEDPAVKKFHKNFQNLAEKIADVDKKIKTISKMNFLDKDNNPLPEDKASEQRALMFEKCGEERLTVETELKQKKELLELHIQSRKRMGVQLTKGNEDVNTGTCTWFVSLYGDEDASFLEELIIKKNNWPGIRLAGAGTVIKNGETVNVSPWAGRAASVPAGKKVTEYDYRRLEVAVSAVRMMRVPAGVGLIKKLDRKSSSMYDEEFGMFYGEFESGKKEGYGIEINDTGIFAGRYCNGFREGQARMDYADGTTITGNFSLRFANEVSGYETSEFTNPYRDGEPNGMVEIHFPDGGYYKGNMTDGVITGQGDYQSAFNEVFSGTFKDGLLNGPNGFWQNVAEDIYTGNFVNGELCGKGSYMNKRGDSYIGYWDSQMRHGRGTTYMKKSSRHKGYYITGYRHGRGTLEYGTKRMTLNKYKAEFSKAKSTSIPDPNSTTSTNPTSTAPTTTTANSTANNTANTATATVNTDSKTTTTTTTTTTDTTTNPNPTTTTNGPETSEETLSEFDTLYQGFFVGNSITNGGSAMDTKIRTPSTISRLNQRATVDIFRVIEKEVAYRKETQRVVEKLADMELFIREEICSKKVKIYNQQKHYTKKTMYADDKHQVINKNELQSKMVLRNERLGGLTEDSHQFKKAMVPRLREINNTRAEHLTNAFNRIRPTDVKDMKKEDRVRDQKVKIAMSDFEEALERQRFLKYDLIWQRAENAFIQKKKSSLE